MACTGCSFPPVLFERDGQSQSIIGGEYVCRGGRFSWFIKIGEGRLPAFVLKTRLCRIVPVNTNVRWAKLGQGEGGRTGQK